MKMESAYYRAINRLFSVGVGFIFRAEDFPGIEGRVVCLYHLTAIPNISKCAPPNSGPDPKNALGGSSFEK
jgi:hypothetical protein